MDYFNRDAGYSGFGAMEYTNGFGSLTEKLQGERKFGMAILQKKWYNEYTTDKGEHKV